MSKPPLIAIFFETLEDIEERQRIAAAQGDDTDVLAYYAERRLSQQTYFICAAAASSTAANFTGKSSRSSTRRNLCPHFSNSFISKLNTCPSDSRAD